MIKLSSSRCIININCTTPKEFFEIDCILDKSNNHTQFSLFCQENGIDVDDYDLLRNFKQDGSCTFSLACEMSSENRMVIPDVLKEYVKQNLNRIALL